LLTDRQTNKQTNNSDYVSSLAEVIRRKANGLYKPRWEYFCRLVVADYMKTLINYSTELISTLEQIFTWWN